MKRRDDRLGDGQASNKFFYALSHFGGGLVRKSHRQNGLWHHVLVLDEVRDPKRDNARFPAAGPCQNEHGTVGGLGGFALLWV